MRHIVYEITATNLVNPHRTLDYKDVVEAREKLKGVQVKTICEEIPRPVSETSPKRQAILEQYGYVKPIRA